MKKHDSEKKAIIELLKSSGEDLDRLYREADETRRKYVGDEVYLRGIVEFSNICRNDCLYCGIRKSNRKIVRYLMTPEEILDVAKMMVDTPLNTIVLQSGERPGPQDRILGETIKAIKEHTNLTITLSAGNRDYDTYKYLRDCGMDRYLLRFETSNPLLFETFHKGSTLKERLMCIEHLKNLGVQTGSGFMIGLPGETYETLAENILLCKELDLDMIGIGPFIPHGDTPLKDIGNAYDDKEIFFKALSVLRIFNKEAHIPATTSYDAVFKGQGRKLALKRGANIYMPNITPTKYRKEYQLYPGKPHITDNGEESIKYAISTIGSINRPIGQGPGDSIKKRRKTCQL
ncbi:MAG: [FeFe] hydrogenase H-cluster radical SAM maturase HydE [Syntrophorhabdaceae bacterium]|nr:[FeFe] hydrogenase H-cluster radical SAM maturase HydE [Syntrophorhabdaceae bacterium]